MRRVPRHATGERISLSLPAEPASVPLARTAAVGLLQHRAGGAAGGAQLASVVADLMGAALARARPRDRLRIHFDLEPSAVVVTVERRRPGRLQPGAPFVESRAVTFDHNSTHGRRGGGRRASRN